jgi:hypothetical protein
MFLNKYLIVVFLKIVHDKGLLYILHILLFSLNFKKIETWELYDVRGGGDTGVDRSESSGRGWGAC